MKKPKPQIVNNKKVKEVIDDIIKVFKKHKLVLCDIDYIITQLVILNKFQLEIAQEKVIKIIVDKLNLKKK